MFKKKKEEKMIIGYYSKSVFITYIGVISGTIGMFLALSGKISFALMCLVFSGIYIG